MMKTFMRPFPLIATSAALGRHPLCVLVGRIGNGSVHVVRVVETVGQGHHARAHGTQAARRGLPSPPSRINQSTWQGSASGVPCTALG